MYDFTRETVDLDAVRERIGRMRDDDESGRMGAPGRARPLWGLAFRLPHTFLERGLPGGFCGRCPSLRSRSRRLKAGGSQDWLPHDLCRRGARIKKYVASGFQPAARTWPARGVSVCHQRVNSTTRARWPLDNFSSLV